MKKRTNKKGFTLVELLVVIAILAVLATVSVVGYLGFTKKAKISNDISLTTQMNTILQAEEAGGETFDTPHDAVEALKNGGLDISKLTPTTNDYSYVYDLKQNRFFLLDENYDKVAPSNQEYTKDSDGKHTQLYAFVGSNADFDKIKKSKLDGCSFYLKDNFTFSGNIDARQSVSTLNIQDISPVNTLNYSKIFGYDGTVGEETKAASTSLNSITVKTGLDAGSNKNIKVTFEGNVSSDIVIRTTGDQSQVEITVGKDSSSDASVAVYGFAQSVKVTAEKKNDSETTTASTTVSVAGSCKDLTVESGKVEVEETAMITKATVTSGAKVKNEGYIGEAKDNSGNDVSGSIGGSKKVGGDYEISTLAQLEAFRDTVNAGNDFSDFNTAGKTVVLKSDITLNNGWTPIGEGFRKVVSGNKTYDESTVNAFKGTFNGNGHTISNLNNINYTPTQARLYDDGGNAYCYGLFALVNNATIKDLKLSNVNIDGSRYASATMDSVAGLVGYAHGDCSFSNITVSGSIKAADAVGGIVGRWYNISKEVSISGCVNNASITGTGTYASSGNTSGYQAKAAGILGYTQAWVKNNSGTYDGKLNVSNCTNNGSVTISITGNIVNDRCYADGLATFQNNTLKEKVINNNSTNNGTISNYGSNNNCLLK